MWFDWMGAISRRNGNIPGLPPLEDRINQDSQYNIVKFVISNDYIKYIGFLKNNNASKFEKKRLFIKNFMLSSFTFAILLDLVIWLLAIVFKNSSFGTIFAGVAIGVFAIVLIYYFLYIKFAIILYYKKLYAKYHKYFTLILKNNCITNDIDMYPTSLKMSLVQKEEYNFKYANSNFPQFQYVTATWALCIFIDKLNTNNLFLDK